MTIDIHQPKLEELIQQRMASGLYRSVEDALIHALESNSPQPANATPHARKKSFTQFMRESPLAGSNSVFERVDEVAEPIDL